MGKLTICRWASDVEDNYADVFQDVWGYLMSIVYKPNSTDTYMLHGNVRREVRQIGVDTYANVINSFKKRVREGRLQMD